MASTDWWTSSTSSPQAFHTPQRPSSVPQIGSQARFKGDELDPMDYDRAEGIKFIPSFANSPAGKLAMGNMGMVSPGATVGGGGLGSVSMGMCGSGSPPGSVGGSGPGSVRRSPQARFSVDSSSPRNTRGSRHTPTMNHMAMDEDAPPTASLHDQPVRSPSSNPPSSSGPNPGPGPSSHSSYPLSQSLSAPSPSHHLSSSPQPISHLDSSINSVPAPPSLTPSQNTTTLHVFGPPMDSLAHLGPYFDQIGQVVKYSPGPEGSNWYDLEYASPTSALYALRRHGEIINGRWMLGFKVAREGSTSGCTLVEGYSSSPNANGSGSGAGPRQGGEMTHRPGPGTPLRIQHTQVMKTKTGSGVVAKPKVVGEAYAWDEPEGSQGIVNKAAEWLFGR